MKTRLIVLCSAALFATAAAANDPESAKDTKDNFATLDTDSDGKISKEEAAGSANLSSSFTMIDRNSDGYISKGEFRRNTMPKPKSDY
jgi:Ca2+-binding EF-hand superfamily protein